MDLKQSYRHGASSAPLIGQTIGSFLSTISEKHGDREALVVPFQNVRMTYRELYRDAERFAAGLKKMGLQPGDRIAILSQNNAEWVIAQFGTAIAGLILITVNPSYRLSELEHVLSKSGCRAIIATPSLKTTNFMDRAGSALHPAAVISYVRNGPWCAGMCNTRGDDRSPRGTI